MPTEEEVRKAEKGKFGWNPEVTDSEVLPGGWADYAESHGVRDADTLYSSWAKFKDLTAYPYKLTRWTGWLQNEQSFHD